ncbi:hypothetical protein P3G55_07395 [Leptospira sp. 96542]|nr:hypothetical protein [Leptospira sp. 96542]
MKSKSFLIIGGSGEAGRSAIQQLKAENPDHLVVATTTTESPIVGADLTLFGKNAEPGLAKKIKEDLEARKITTNFDVVIYTPALGEVGFPIQESTQDQINRALQISFDPMLEIETTFKPELSVLYSAFYWLPHTLSFYGSMGVVKYKSDLWSLEKPKERKIIRAGTFFSKSVRGISLILQRTMKTTKNPDLLTLKQRFEKSNQKFIDFFLSYAWEHEKKEFGYGQTSEYRPTEGKDLSRGLKEALKMEEPIVTVLGDWTWFEKNMPSIPSFFKNF